MESFIVALMKVKELYDIYKEITDLLIDETVVILNKIGCKQVKAAIQTLNDAKYSNNKEREYESAITQLRLALETVDSSCIKFQIAGLIALCYKILNEDNLASIFRDRSILYFKEYTLSYYESARLGLIANYCTVPGNPYSLATRKGRILGFIFSYNQLVTELKNLGLNIKENKMSKLEAGISIYGKNIVSSMKRLIDNSEKLYIVTIDNVLFN